jgi:predicted amidophosphoribosyltransferase
MVIKITEWGKNLVQFCPKCGTKAPDDEAVFCNKCGNKLPLIIPEKKDDSCPSCGTKIVDMQSQFCNRCGNPLSVIPPSSQPPKKVVLTSPQKIEIEKKCPSCGFPIDNDDRFYCKSCGVYLKGSEPAQMRDNLRTVKDSRPSEVKIFGKQKITREQFEAYKTNWILLIVFALALLSIAALASGLLIILVIVSAIAVYYDAKAIKAGAGAQYSNESTMDILSWNPVSWGLIVLLLWIIGLPLYLYKRKEIFFFNYQETPTNEDQWKRQSQPPITESLPKSKTTAEWITICCGGIILLVIVSAVLSSVLSGVNLSNSKDEIITQSLSSMALTINDMPTGWRGSGSPSTSGDAYSASFVNPTPLDPEVVSLKIQKFSSVEQAKTAYNSRQAENPNLKMEPINIGTEGFGYVNVNDIFVIFRRGNILVTIEDVKSQYSWSLNLDDAKGYAKTVAGRIQ